MENNNKGTLEIGRVRWFNSKKKFGFIEAQDGKDVFVHWTQIISRKDFKILFEGDKVVFTRKSRPKGDYATMVSVLEPEIKIPYSPEIHNVSEETE